MCIRDRSRETSRANKYAAAARIHFDIVNDRSKRHELELHAAADIVHLFIGCHDDIADFEALRG